MGGEEGTPAPQAPTPQSYGSTIQDYIQNYPQLFELMQKYGPQEATMQKNINETLYPQTAGLQENLATQATQGMNQSTPEWYNQNVRDTLKSQFGRNLVYNPQAQEQYGLATNQAKEDWRRYYQSLGTTLSGKQPLATYSNNITSQYSPNQATQYAANTYGTQAGIYGNQLSYNAQMQPYTMSNQLWNLGGSLAGGAAGIGTMGVMNKMGWMK